MEAWLLVVWCATCTPAQYVANIEPYVRLDACLATRNQVAGISRWQDCDKAPCPHLVHGRSPTRLPCRVGTSPTALARPLRSRRGIRLAVGLATCRHSSGSPESAPH